MSSKGLDNEGLVYMIPRSADSVCSPDAELDHRMMYDDHLVYGFAPFQITFIKDLKLPYEFYLRNEEYSS